MEKNNAQYKLVLMKNTHDNLMVAGHNSRTILTKAIAMTISYIESCNSCPLQE